MQVLFLRETQQLCSGVVIYIVNSQAISEDTTVIAIEREFPFFNLFHFLHIA